MKKKLLLCSISLTLALAMFGQGQSVMVRNSSDGSTLTVGDRPFMVNGMNWDYFPIGTNFNYSLWKQPDDLIRAALDDEMSMLKQMGVNTIRVYTGIPKRWIQHIYEQYGIYTMLNHSFGRYGLTLNGAWVPNTEYSDPRTRELLLKETKQMVEEYRNTPGLLLYLLGNENNYGLFWDGAETEDIPMEDRKATKRAQYMYQLFNEATVQMKQLDQGHPVAICNGDLLFLDLIKENCKDVDILGLNMYRGKSFGDAFDRVRKEYGKPILFTEFGADAFNAKDNEEDQKPQADVLLQNWKEIYANAAGMGKAGNSLGGFTFQFSDGWWKNGQTTNLEVHDNNASWQNGGYQSDYVKGENNMNEEWFGICAKGLTNERGLYQLFPRAAYYALQEAHRFNPYGTRTLEALNNHFASISLQDQMLRARSDKAALDGEAAKKIRFTRLTGQFTTFSTGGSLISTPKTPDPNNPVFPDQLGFDHMESFFIGVGGNPAPNLRFNVEMNVLGNVATNPIDQIFYETRGRAVETVDGQPASAAERIQVYRAEVEWNTKHFDLKGFYRTGHYHWGYEGDFFGLYPEANYGPNIDIYNGLAPIGMEIAAKKKLTGLKIAFGPQLWWGANPAILAKYTRAFGQMKMTAIFHEDLQQLENTESSFAIPVPRTRRATLHIGRKFGNLGIDIGGIWAGQPLVGRVFQATREENGVTNIYQDEITGKDTWGGKIKLTYSSGRLNWYASAAAAGLVANGGFDQTQTFTGWRLKDNGSGNQYNVLSGLTLTYGSLQIAPNFLWQKPIEGPIPVNGPAPGRPRNILDDPFAVRINRETVAGEILFTYDPTPGTWMYDWDNDNTEDSEFSLSAGFVYRHLPTIQDAAIGIFPDGRTTFPFPGSAPAQDLWEANARIVSKLNKDFGFIALLYGGTGQANGSDARLVERFGMDLRFIYKKVKLMGFFKVNDWGPYDYHRDFNQTFPLQWMADFSVNLGKPRFIDVPTTRFGVRGTWRSLDQFSPRYAPIKVMNDRGIMVPDPTAVGFPNGQEWEIRTYLHINIFN